jgi:Flp pilus assembly protein protease CpaA
MSINAISTIALIVLAGCALLFLAQMMGSSPQQA